MASNIYRRYGDGIYIADFTIEEAGSIARVIQAGLILAYGEKGEKSEHQYQYKDDVFEITADATDANIKCSDYFLTIQYEGKKVFDVITEMDAMSYIVIAYKPDHWRTELWRLVEGEDEINERRENFSSSFKTFF